MKSIKFSFITFVCLTLSGCATMVVPYHKTDPEAAIEEMKKHNGYYELKKTPEVNSKIIFRTVSNSAVTAYFSKVKTTGNCINQEKIGAVIDGNRENLSPQWKKIHKAFHFNLGTKPSEYLMIEAIPDEPITIRVSGHYLSNNGHTITTANCGPFIKQFTPQSRKSYLVEYQWKNGCRLIISDATDPDKPLIIDVPAQKEIPLCK
jgi:hypothetical protein